MPWASPYFLPGGFAPPDPPTRSLAGTPTPLRSRGSLAIARSRRISNQLVFAGPDDQVGQARGLGCQLCIGTGPGPAGARVVDEGVVRVGWKRWGGHTIERP